MNLLYIGYRRVELPRFDERLKKRWTPADKNIESYEHGASLGDILQSLTELQFAGKTKAIPQDLVSDFEATVAL